MLARELSVVRVAAAQAGTSVEVMSELARELLGDTGWPSTPSSSGLNNDDSPLQACVSCSARGIGVRLVADPCVGAADMEARVAASLGVLDRLLQRKRGSGLEHACGETIRLGIPAVGRRRELPAGGLWLAAGVTDPGAALYVTCAWGEPTARWARVDAWLDAVLPDGRLARHALSQLREHAQPVSLGIEGHRTPKASDPEVAAKEGHRTPAGPGIRAKVYVRLERAVPLAQLGLPSLCDPSLVRFLTAVIGNGSVRSPGLLLCASFSTASGGLAGVKIDLCAHCLPRPPAAWSTTITALARASSLPVPTVLPAVVDGSVEVALLGWGVDGEGRPRLNVYLKCP